MSRFQIIFTAILVVLGVGGAVLFAVSKGKGSQSAVQLTMWGGEPSSVVASFLSDTFQQAGGTQNVTYVEKNPATLESELVSALARGQGPDLLLVPQDLVVPQSDKFYAIPYDTFSERDFRDSFIQEGELFLTPAGAIGLPFSVDPIVMFWNRSLFTDAGVAKPPVSWVELFDLAPKLVKKDQNGNIVQAMAALGEVRNVAHGKDMLALLSLQAGTPIVARTAGGGFQSVFAAPASGFVPAERALSFFTEFSNPVKASYTWNRSLPLDLNVFAAGRLAIYFGPASEAGIIRSANPNLDFDVALVPQAEGGKATLGRMTALSILRSSANPAAAYQLAAFLTSAGAQSIWNDKSGLPPVRRDLLVKAPSDAYRAVTYQSALISRGWLEPGSLQADGVFLRMVENVTSGRLRVSESVSQASGELDTLLSSHN
jgi:multiple sugar transport system substrate-binding protein